MGTLMVTREVYKPRAEPGGWWREPDLSPFHPAALFLADSKCKILQLFFSLDTEMETQLSPGMGRGLWGEPYKSSKGGRQR